MKNSFCKGWIKLKEDISVIYGSLGLKVEVANHSNQNWRSGGSNPVFISYHWLDEDWNMVVYEGSRTPLTSGGIAAGASIIALAEVDPPNKPGAYQLMLTLVREGMYWFEDAEHFEAAIVKIRVERDAAHDDIGKVANTGELVDQTGRGTQIMHGDSSCVCIKPYEKGRRFGFMHIPKTAGSSMSSFLLKVIRPKTHGHVRDPIFCTGTLGPIDTVLPQVDCYFGHISLENLLKCCPDGQYLTVFREASCRILSHWFFWASLSVENERPEVNYSRRFGDISASLMGKLLNPKIACQFDNVALRMLVWPHQAVPDVGFIDKKDDAELLELAMDRLKRFGYLDVIENPWFEANLKNWLGTEVPYERLNVTAAIANQSRIDLRREFTAGALEALEARSRLDRVLWTTVAATRLPGVDLARLTRDSLMTNVARYSSITSLSA